MAGLLDGFGEFIKTPEGQGLLSGVMGYAANARQGTPINNLGRGGLAGIMGYGGALDRQTQAAEAAQTGKYRDMQQQSMQMQIEEAKRKAAEAKGQADWRTGLPGVMSQKTYGSSDEGPTMAPDQAALDSYLMHPNSPYADDVMKSKLFPKAADYKVVGDSLLQVGASGVKPVYTKPEKVNPNQPFMMVDGKVVPNSDYQTYELSKAKAGASRTNVSLSNVGPKAFEAELGKMDADQLGKWRDGAQAAQNTLGSVKRLEDADAKGAYSGGAANLKMTVGSYINGLTGATPKGQVGSELYTAEANNLVLSQVKALGANPSNADVIFIQKTVPQLSTNAEARKALTQFMREKAQASVGLYQRANTHARKNSGLGGFEVVEPTGDIDSLVNKYK